MRQKVYHFCLHLIYLDSFHLVFFFHGVRNQISFSVKSIPQFNSLVGTPDTGCNRMRCEVSNIFMPLLKTGKYRNYEAWCGLAGNTP